MNQQYPNTAFIFPGQGSQSIGMLSKLADAYPVVKQTFEQASSVLKLNLWELVANGPEAELNQTQNTQPAMLAAGVAVWRVWLENSGKNPDWLAGHSLGEYTALACAEAIGFEDAIRLVAERGRLMQEAVPAGLGAMAAILGLEDEQVINACSEAAQGEIVTAANFNSPGQVVIAGETAAVKRAMANMKALGAKRVLELPVSVPSHCALMAGASEKLHEMLQSIKIETPKMSVIHNADVKSHQSPELIRHVLEEQLFKPVRWVETVKFLQTQGVENFVECGPGKVLIGLNKRIAAEAAHFSLFDPESINNALEELHA